MNDDITKKDRLWLLPDSDKRKIDAGLYLVATPIGNLRDITIRALDTLEAADVVVCEDTRVTGKLLSYYGLKKKLVVYNDHSADKVRAGVLRDVAAGKIVAMVSDAGSPLVSDPGFKLARDGLADGLNVTALPGASAPIAALQLSGLPSDAFSFIGFLPSKKGARASALEGWKSVSGSLIAFESAGRLVDALRSIHEVLGDRNVAVVREITKMYEESRRGAVSELIAHYEAEGPPKGEIVLVVEQGVADYGADDIEAMLRDALQSMSTKDAAGFVAEQTGQSKKALYDQALKLSKDG